MKFAIVCGGLTSLRQRRDIERQGNVVPGLYRLGDIRPILALDNFKRAILHEFAPTSGTHRQQNAGLAFRSVYMVPYAIIVNELNIYCPWSVSIGDQTVAMSSISPRLRYHAHCESLRQGVQDDCIMVLVDVRQDNIIIESPWSCHCSLPRESSRPICT
jgi:hypothetical protein